ncbi:MAG: OmpA family protein [Acidobacteriia bacterium]|nr:OmpA family protein [Terriglobia bacterium]
MLDTPQEERGLDDESGHRGGAWKVAYADFVTALMALFIVLWLVSAGREVREAVSGYFRDPRGHHQLSGTAQAGSGESLAVDRSTVQQLRKKMEQALHDLPDFQRFSKNVQFTVTGEGLRVELMEKEGGMFFSTGSPRPTSDGERLFDLLGQELGGLPNQIAIEGHTDARAFRSQTPDSYGNWELSFDRANMARRIMVSAGLSSTQVTEIRGYADNRTLISADPTDSRNRRVSVIVKYQDK